MFSKFILIDYLRTFIIISISQKENVIQQLINAVLWMQLYIQWPLVVSLLLLSLWKLAILSWLQLFSNHFHRKSKLRISHRIQKWLEPSNSFNWSKLEWKKQLKPTQKFNWSKRKTTKSKEVKKISKGRQKS